MKFKDAFTDSMQSSRFGERFMKEICFCSPPKPDILSYAFSLSAYLSTDLHYPCSFSSRLPAFTLLYVKDGDGALAAEEQTCLLSKDFVAFLCPDVPFSVFLKKTDPSLSVCLFFIEGNSLAAYHAAFLGAHGTLCCETASGRALSLLAQLPAAASDAGFYKELLLSNMLSDLLTALILDKQIREQYGSVPAHILHTIAYLEEHFREELTLDSLAAHFATSKFTLSRDFTAATGCSLYEYLLKLRIRESCRLLHMTSDSVSEIAAAAGFRSANNFTLQFKKRTGETPLSYRKRQQACSSDTLLLDHSGFHP